MPTLVTSYFAESSHLGDATALSTPSFTPADGELLVVKAATWSTGTPSGTPSGGSLTYTQQATAAPGGFNGYGTIFTAAIATSPGSMSITLSAPGASCYHSMVVERWSQASLAGTPAVSSPTSGAGTPSATIATTSNNSVVTWVAVDENSNNPAGRAYLSSATEDGLGDAHSNSDTVQYYAYQAAATTGSQTIGMSAPGSQAWAMIGMEILDAPATPVHTGAFIPFFDSL